MWCVLQVRQGSEERIRRQCQEKLPSDLVKNCYVFYYEEKRHVQGEWVIKEKPLFPGYVFIDTEKAEEFNDELFRIMGQTKLLETGGYVTSLSETEENFLKTFTGKDQLLEISEGVIEKSKIKVYSGPLVGKEKYICRIDRHKRRAFLELPMFGRRQKIQVGLEIVSKT